MSRAKEQERLHALRDRDEAKTVHTTQLKMVAISFEGDSSAFAEIVDEAFGLAREASLARKPIDMHIRKKGVRAHVKVDP